MHYIIKALAGTVIFLLFMAAIILIGRSAVDKMEIQDCYKWQQYHRDYQLFQLNPEDEARCEARNIPIK